MAGAPARAAPSPRRSDQAEPAPRTGPARARGSRRAVEKRARVAGGVVWIAAVAALLAGIVALNVAVLQLNVELERLDARKEKLSAENARLASELASATAAWRIEAVARGKLGLVAADETTYVRLDTRRP